MAGASQVKQSRPSSGRNEAKPGARGSGGGALPPRQHAATRRAARLAALALLCPAGPPGSDVLGWDTCLLHVEPCSELSILLRGTGRPAPWGAARPPTLSIWDRGEQGVARGMQLPKSASGHKLSSPRAFSEPCRAESCRAEPLRCCIMQSGFNLGGKNILLVTLVESRGLWPRLLAPALAFRILAPMANFPSPPTAEALALRRGNFPLPAISQF